MGVYICNEGPYPEVTDILSTDGSNINYHPYYDCGVCITAKVNCTIDKIGFLGGYIIGSLWIAQGTTSISYDANTKVEYSITSFTYEFTLPTPYEMQANTDYVIIVNGSGPRYNYETPFPKDCENIIYKHAAFAGTSATDRKFFITPITTTQTGTYLEEKPLQNAYIGEYRVPGANTIAYYPLTSETTVNDLSGNNRNLTNYNGVAFGTYAGVDCSYFAGNKMILYNSSFPARGTSSWTFSCWMYTTSNNQQTVISMGNSASTSLFLVIKNGLIDGTSISVSLNQWHNIVYTVGNNTLKMYVDGVEQYSSSSYTVSNTASIGLGRDTYAEDKNYLGYLSQVIVENQVRTADQVSNYYNSTKSNYGL